MLRRLLLSWLALIAAALALPVKWAKIIKPSGARID